MHDGKMRKLSGKFREKLSTTGFFNIAGASLINKLIAFICNIAIVWILPKDVYGSYSFANNIISYFLLFNGFGVAASIVQVCVEKEADEKAADSAFQTASIMGIAFDLILSFGLLCFALFSDLTIEGSNILLLFFLPLPITTLLFDLQQQRLRSLFQHKEFARATNVNSISTALFSVVGAFIGSAAGLVLGRCIAMLLSVAYIGFRHKVYPRCNFGDIDRSSMRDIASMAVTICLTNAVSQALILVGTTIIGFVGKSQAEVASYSVATTIPFAFLFIPGILQTYALPYLVRNQRDRAWVMRFWKIGVGSMVGVCGMISAICIVGAAWIVPTLFGEQYSDSVLAFQVLMLAFAIAGSLRAVSGVILGSHRKYSFNLVASCASLAVSVVLTLLLIPHFGFTGAAIGYLSAIIVGTVFSMVGVVVFAGNPSSSK